MAVTTAPVVMNLYRNDDFIFNNPVSFPERFDSEDGYFSGEIKRVNFGGFGHDYGMIMSNLVPDIHALELGESNRGINTRVLGFDMAEGTLGAHTLTFPGGTFSKLHRHGPGAHVIWLEGEGYNLMWPDGGEWIQEFWSPGAMLVPPSGWWHQHCVVTSTPAQHLALRLGSRTFRLDRQGTGVLRSTREGGSQMDYEDFPPEVMAKVMGMFTSECAERGTPPHMEAVGG